MAKQHYTLEEAIKMIELKEKVEVQSISRKTKCYFNYTVTGTGFDSVFPKGFDCVMNDVNITEQSPEY